jgi:hypothetical protein
MRHFWPKSTLFDQHSQRDIRSPYLENPADEVVTEQCLCGACLLCAQPETYTYANLVWREEHILRDSNYLIISLDYDHVDHRINEDLTKYQSIERASEKRERKKESERVQMKQRKSRRGKTRKKKKLKMKRKVQKATVQTH